MNGIIGMTGLLLDTNLDDEQRHYAGIVRSSGESLLALINDILDFSKIEAKKLDLETVDFDLLNLLDDFLVTLALRAHEKGLELLCAVDLNIPSLLQGDPGRLRQILTNLARNAIKFTHHGEIAVRVKLIENNEQDAEKSDESNTTDPPIWDRDKMMERLLDDEYLAKMIQDRFLADIPQRIQALKAFLESGDVSGVGFQAHSINGASANMGGERLRAVASEMENAAKSQDLTAASSFMNELERQFDRLKEEMQ